MDKPEILDMKVEEMPNYRYLCPCGREHGIDINRIEMGKGVIEKLPDILHEFKNRTILIVCDENTLKIAGEKVQNILESSGFKTRMHVAYSPDYPILIPDAFTIGRLMIAAEDDTDLILGVGSGTINDVCKIVSYKMKLDSVIVCTAPSMDGYASTLSPLIVDRQKVTYPSHYPYAIVADIDIMKDAPLEMLRAGFGDIVGKYTALTDWRLTVIVNKEYYCDTTARLMQNAVDKVVENTERYFSREVDAIYNVTEALMLAGISMGLVGISRPASGSEHHLAHFWELDALARGIEHPLHGNSVGVGSIITSEAYRIMSEKFEEPKEANPPSPDLLREIYKRADMPLTPKDLGIDKDVFHNSIRNAYRIRPRYTIFNYTKDRDLLDKMADDLTDIFY